MQVIHMWEWQERMQRSVDGSGNTICVERWKRVVGHHFVFMGFPAVNGFELLQTVEREQRKSGFLDGANISAAAFHRKYADRVASERVRKIDLRAGIPTTEIGDAQV